MTQLPNGLSLIDEGNPGDEDSGDTILSLVTKINNNFKIILTEYDSIAGKGLKQIGRKLESTQYSPDIVDVDLSIENSVSLSNLNNNSVIRPFNETESSKTLVLESLEEVELGHGFWIGYINTLPLTLRFDGGKFLNSTLSSNLEGQITINNPTSLRICKLDNIHWMTLF